MRTKEELRSGCAILLQNLQNRVGLKDGRMAGEAGIDPRTWERYITGQAAPRVDEFISWFDYFEVDALPMVLEYLYPEVYSDLSDQSETKALRKAAIHYVENIASPHAVRKFDYLVFGGHGSNIEAQSEEWLMLDHLPLTMRLAVAALIDTLYETAVANGLLVNTDCVMPKMGVFHDGLRKGREAVMDGRNSYTTSSTSKKP